MRCYRAYKHDDGDHIFARTDFRSQDDNAAIEHARRMMVDGHDIELWQEGRQVAVLRSPTHPKDDSLRREDRKALPDGNPG
jgi:hypothetical protein